MKFLVTGGCGFIGSNFIRFLLTKYDDCTIVNLDKLTYAGNEENLADVETDRYTFVHGDICDAELVTDLVKDVDVIVHFAAESHVDRSIASAEDFVRTNVTGTLTLLDAAVQHNTRFHHVSTDEVFGELGETGSFSETSPYNPRSPYSASKAAADHLVMAYHHTHDLPVTITYCANNYGPYQHPEKVIPRFITNLLQGKELPVYGDGSNVREWLYVLDHCEAIDLVIKKGRIGNTYCCGSSEQLANIALAKKILELMGQPEEKIMFVEDRKGHDFRYALDSTKLQRELGWEPKHNFEEGLRETIAWYKEHTPWWQMLISSS